MRLQSFCTSLLLNGFLCCLFLLSFSCATITKGEASKDGLGKAATQFNTALRWADPQRASVWIPAPAEDDFWKLIDKVHKQIRVMDFEIRKVSYEENSDLGSVRVYFRYYHLNDPTVRDLTLHQKWRFDENKKAWKVVQHDIETLLVD
jgi:hypothetical protein